MRLYETIFILRSDLADEQAEEVARDILAEFPRLNLEVLRVESWGKKRLAYIVKKHKYGYYTLVYFHGAPEQITKLERFFWINEQVIKSIVVRVEREREVLAMIAAQTSHAESSASAAQSGETRQDNGGGAPAAQPSESAQPSPVSVQEPDAASESAPGEFPEEST